MFVKQIDMTEALGLAAKGQEIKVLVPIGPGTGWESFEPDTLQNMLADVRFFRNEPALESARLDTLLSTLTVTAPPGTPDWRIGPQWTVVPNGPR